MRRSAFLAALLLGGCAVGPSYKTPPAPPAVLSEVEPAQAYETPDRWWQLFNDPTLDRLVADALAHNTDIRVAAANLKRARATLTEARTGRLPTGNATAGYTRNRITGGASAATSAQPGLSNLNVDTDFFTAGFDMNYEVDLFGRVTRSIQAARADRDAAAAALDAARVSIAAETARSYAAACGYAAQADVARETLRLQSSTLDLTRRQVEAGSGTRREIDQAAVLVEQARAQVPTYEAEHRAALHALATLTGRLPSQIDSAAASCRATPRVTQLIPTGDGASLLRRRPDVRQAERTLAADTARIGIAVAGLFPQVTLGGTANLGATRISNLDDKSAFTFSFGPLISWAIPNFPIARARIRQTRATAEASLASYDGAVLTALNETEQALARYQGLLETNAALSRAEAASADSAQLSRLRFNAGSDSFLQLLDAERSRAQARAQLAQSDAQLADAQVSLFKALGGGWQQAPAPQRRVPGSE